MTPLFNDADQNLLRALPAQTRKAVVELVGRSWRRAILDTEECIRAAVKGFPTASVMRIVLSDLADSMARRALPLPALDLPSVPTPDPTTLSDAEILDLPPLDRARVLADLAAKGHHLIAVLLDVGIPCTNDMCMDGRVRISGDVVVDCHVCDGVGSVDGRRRCADRGCLSYDEPLTYSLGNGWECSRKHGHAERERAVHYDTIAIGGVPIPPVEPVVETMALVPGLTATFECDDEETMDIVRAMFRGPTTPEGDR